MNARRQAPAQDVVEYGMLIAVIALVVLMATGGTAGQCPIGWSASAAA